MGCLWEAQRGGVITYRLLRIGWAIKKDDFESLRRAVKLSFALWGGRFNPILVIDDYEDAEALMEAFRVDFIHPVGNAPELKEFIKWFPHLVNPIIGQDIISRQHDGRGTAHVLDVHNALAYYFQRPEWAAFKKEGIGVYSWADDDPLADLFLIQYGAYLKDLFTRLPAAKITQIKEFTPATWARTEAKEKMLEQAA